MRLLALPELKIHTLFPCLCFPQQVPDVPRHDLSAPSSRTTMALSVYPPCGHSSALYISLLILSTW